MALFQENPGKIIKIIGKHWCSITHYIEHNSRPFLSTAVEKNFSKNDFLNLQDQIGAFLGGLNDFFEGNYNGLSITGRQKIAKKWRSDIIDIGYKMLSAKPADIRSILEHPVVLNIDGEEQAKFFRFAVEMAKIDRFLRLPPISKVTYDRPYTLSEIEKNYPKLAETLVNDPLHRWRAETGIELLHKEPSISELDRVWSNWNAMTPSQKRLSDEKSLELFGMTNRETYEKYRVDTISLRNTADIYSSSNLSRLSEYKTALALEQDA